MLCALVLPKVRLWSPREAVALAWVPTSGGCLARFIVSHRLAGRSATGIQTSRDAHDAVRSNLRAFANVVSEQPSTARTRGLVVADGNPAERMGPPASAAPD